MSSVVPSGAEGSASATPSTPSGERAGGDDVRPVYPPLTGPPHPLAERLCDALHEAPARRRAACCGRPEAALLTGECQRNLTGALASGAVSIAEADLDRCREALDREVAGCDWVAPFPAGPPMPAACRGVVRGELAAGATCRSSLECQTGQRCHGLGPTQAGRCGPPRAEGRCGGSVDALATYVRVDDLDGDHPECAGHCDRARCARALDVGASCRFHAQCGPGAHCGDDGRCARGEHGAEGQRCLGTRCAPGLRCVKGTCAAPRREGEACDTPAQCRGRCVRDAAGQGRCTADCGGNWPAVPTPAPTASSRSPRRK